MGMERRSAWRSKKEPVPAARCVHGKVAHDAVFDEDDFESCPPISSMVATSGKKHFAATAWAVISFFTTSAPATTPRADGRCPWPQRADLAAG
jgi:hypothetical protein